MLFIVSKCRALSFSRKSIIRTAFVLLDCEKNNCSFYYYYYYNVDDNKTHGRLTAIGQLAPELNQLSSPKITSLEEHLTLAFKENSYRQTKGSV